MSLYGIAADYNGPLEAAHARSDDDRYDLVGCGAAGQPDPALDNSDQVRDCSIASTYAKRLGSEAMLRLASPLNWLIVFCFVFFNVDGPL